MAPFFDVERLKKWSEVISLDQTSGNAGTCKGKWCITK